MSKPKFFYGWVIVAAILAIGTVVIGARYSFGVYFKDIDTEFQLSRGVTSSILSVATVFGAGFNPLWGWVLDKVGARKVSLALALLTASGFLITSRIGAAWQLFLTYSLLIGMSDGMYATLMSTASRWFQKGRSFAVGLAGCGSGFGVLIMGPLSTWMLSSYGWRDSFVITGVLVLLAASLVFLLRAPPSTMLPAESVGSAGPGKAQPIRAPGLTFKEAIRTRQFWFLAAVWVLEASCILLVTTHIVPHVTDMKLTATMGGIILSIMGGAYIAGRLMTGAFNDTARRKKGSMGCALLGAAAMVFLIFASEPWMLYVFAVALGLAWGGLLNLVTVLVGDIFGMRNMGPIMGSVAGAWIAGSAVGPLLAGYVYDATGSYTWAFVFAAVAMVGAALFLSRIRPLGRSSE